MARCVNPYRAVERSRLAPQAAAGKRDSFTYAVRLIMGELSGLARQIETGRRRSLSVIIFQV
jgi:hypothetical protein